MATTQETKQKMMELTGDQAIAYGAKQAGIDFIAAYPITPQTIIVEKLSEYLADGMINARYINVESEHSAISAVIGAELAGARGFTATSSQGLALMFEELPVAAGMRQPLVMAVAMRALSAPINIHCDHSDLLSVRDQGWVMMIAENAQEAYDQTIMAFKIGEDPAVQLPVMYGIDGFIITHNMENVYTLPDEMVSSYLGVRKPMYRLDPDNPMTFGPLALYDTYFEFRRQQHDAMMNAYQVTKDVFADYERMSGRKYSPLKNYMVDDADVLIFAAGSTVGTARQAARKLREEGVKAGVSGVTLLRPFPIPEVIETFSNVKAVAVLERMASLGSPAGPHYMDLASAVYPQLDVRMYDFVYGLGGRDIDWEMIARCAKTTLSDAEHKRPNEVRFLGVRE
jgi:pyruvate ferredoxin oxidoreductase alpha subunit